MCSKIQAHRPPPPPPQGKSGKTEATWLPNIKNPDIGLHYNILFSLLLYVFENLPLKIYLEIYKHEVNTLNHYFP